MGDDYADAPAYLYVGEKDPDGNFAARNGLVGGQLHVWVANGNNGPRTPEDFNGSGRSRRGKFVPIDARDAGKARLDGYDNLGYKAADTLRSEAREMGAFFFSRPEDVATNPHNPDQAVLASTGRGSINPFDDWGTVYEIDLAFPRNLTTTLDRGRKITAMVEILYDGDETGDAGLRSPDNLDWADDGMVYVQEDRATQLNTFGADSGRDASIWQLDPRTTRDAVRIGEVTGGTELGEWETSGILDVTDLFAGDHLDGTVLLGDVQAHGFTNEAIDANNLVEGSQLFLLFEGTPHDAIGYDDALVIGHRGASGYRPEHTLASYELAIEMGADYIEPDLVLTKDKRLVARHADDAIFVQSFEVKHLRRLDRMTDVRLVQLIGGSGAPWDLQSAGRPTTYEDMTTPRLLAKIAKYADGIGPSFTAWILPLDSDGNALPENTTSLVDDAHAEGLQVHPYTFRRENVFLPANYEDDPLGWFRLGLSTGIDGFFTDNPDLGVAATQPQ